MPKTHDFISQLSVDGHLKFQKRNMPKTPEFLSQLLVDGCVKLKNYKLW